MPLPASAVRRSLPARKTLVDPRWLMSYVAALGDDLPCYVDTTRAGAAKYRPTPDFHGGGMQGAGIIAHPVFVWAVEWPMFWRGLGPLWGGGAGESGLTTEEGLRAVHYQEDIVIHRPIAAGDELETSVRVASVEARAKGSVVSLRCDHTDAAGRPVATSWCGNYYRGVPVEGQPLAAAELAPPPVPPPPAGAAAGPSVGLEVGASDARVYSECARIWNPIHTDRAAALMAGLPDAVLHGTAVLARAVSALVREYAAGDPARVSRVVAGAFGASVLMPSTMLLRVTAASAGGIWFDVLNAERQQAIRGGFLGLHAPRSAM